MSAKLRALDAVERALQRDGQHLTLPIPQFGRDFGSVDVPDCRGLTGSELQTFNWAALDLDQWIAILGTAERFPDLEKLTPDGLTGTGNFLDLVDPNEPRPDIVL